MSEDESTARIEHYDPRRYAVARATAWLTSEAVERGTVDMLHEAYVQLRHKVENEIRESEATPMSGGLLRIVYEQEVQTNEPR